MKTQMEELEWIRMDSNGMYLEAICGNLVTILARK